jgi:hypothetical protein
MQSFPELLSEVEYHRLSCPHGQGKVLFEQGRFALVTQTLADGEHSLLMIVGRRSPNPAMEKMFIVLQLPQLKVSAFKKHALVMRQIINRLVELDNGGWKYYLHFDERERQVCSVKNSVGQEIAFHATYAAHEYEKSPRTTRRLKALLEQLNKVDADSAASKLANQLVVEEVEALFKEDTSKALLNAVISIHPEVPADQQIVMLEEALEELRASHARPAEALVSKNS